MSEDARRLAARRFNERVKLLAGFLNALAVGAIGAGAIIPATHVPADFGWSSAIWLAVGAASHVSGPWVLGLLRLDE